MAVAGRAGRRSPEVPPTRFAPARDARLAYQHFGRGQHTIVAIPPTAQNIEVAWEYPAIRRMLERVGSVARYLHFDKRGTGCSDRHGRIADLDERVDDLRAVMDHAGVRRAHLFGASEGGPMTLLFAVTYPDRVQSITLFGSGATIVPPDLTAAEREQRREGHRRYAALWGTPNSPVAAGFAPSLVAQDPGYAVWHQRYERLAASQDSLLELLDLSLETDVREILPEVTAPVLLLHRTEDRVVPVERAREAAAGLARVELVEQPGEDHFGYAGDVDGWVQVFAGFVTGQAPSARPDPAVVSAVPAISIRSLGGFEVEVDGASVPSSAWGSRRSRQLCKRLVAARGHPVTREALIDLLWPDEQDLPRLRARLSVQLSMVRRVLRGGVISDRETVRLDLDHVHVDLEWFHTAVDDAEVVARYRGPFLPGVDGEDWVEPVREAARRRFLQASHRELGRQRQAGQADAALQLAQRLIEVDRYDDQAQRALVTILLDQGHVAEARRAHARWRDALAELDVAVPALDELPTT